MKKITKYGLSALCGSLAAASAASAGEMSVVGNAHMTWSNLGSASTSGQPLGMKTNLSFIGDGELDGGQTVNLTIAHNDQAAWSSAGITLNTNSLGSWKISSAEGSSGIGGYDDNMPRAWEEVWDAGVSTSTDLQKGVGSSMNVMYTTPKVAGASLKLAYSPSNDGLQVNDKAVGGADTGDHRGRAADVVLQVNPNFGLAGFDFFVGYSETEQDEKSVAAGKANKRGNIREGVAGLTLDIGPVSIGGQGSAEDLATESTSAVEYYGNTSWGLAFNVNDNLSISYGEHRSVRTKINVIEKVWMDGESTQIAYTLGGVSLKFADTDYTNSGYSAGTSKEAKVLSLSMADRKSVV